MSLPAPSNVAVNIYRGFDINNPYPGSGVQPNVGLAGHLKHHVRQGRFGNGLELHWTNVLLLPPGTDIRSAYDSQLNTWQPANADTVLVQDYPIPGWCTAFLVVLVQHIDRGTPEDHYRVYLDRCQPRLGACGPNGKCCDEALPDTLYAFLSNNGGCPCVAGTLFTLQYDGVTRRWKGSTTIAGCGNKPIALELYCPATGTNCGDWKLDVSGCFNATGLTFTTTCLCSPFILQFLINDSAGSCCSSAGFFYITIVT